MLAITDHEMFIRVGLSVVLVITILWGFWQLLELED